MTDGEISLPLAGNYLTEIAVMQEMSGWRLDDVDTAPADLIEEILERRRARMYWESKKASGGDFVDGEN